MKSHEIEAWALRVVDGLQSGHGIEDDRVEAKTIWPEPEKAARQIAGHANAARGERILWLIGVNETTGKVPGAPAREFSNWVAQINSEFDALAPAVFHVQVPSGDKYIAAILFETDRAPFVVRNAAHGKPGGGPVALEVPWREGTALRSARREDLIRILSPLQGAISIEVLAAQFSGFNRKRYRDPVEDLVWSLDMELYVISPLGSRVVIPFHWCKATVHIGRSRPLLIEMENVGISPPTFYAGGTQGSRNLSATVERTRHEVILNGPGKVFFGASIKKPVMEKKPQGRAHVRVELQSVGADPPAPILLDLDSVKSDKVWTLWTLGGQPVDENE